MLGATSLLSRAASSLLRRRRGLQSGGMVFEANELCRYQRRPLEAGGAMLEAAAWSSRRVRRLEVRATVLRLGWPCLRRRCCP
jgi:hypothetical protein